jgi:membrane-associated protease RseP (regulator of RpoE activity)
MEFGKRGSFDLRNLAINSSLLLLTLVTTAIAGVQWAGRDPFELQNLQFGVEYALAILFVLGCHEFGHYFAARFHDVKTTLPYFIPFPPTPFFLNFGTLGALIRTRSPVPNRKAMFDIGIAGPIAGFVACILVLVIGFLTLPPPSYILQIHPDYDFALNASPNAQGLGLEFGQTLLFKLLTVAVTDPQTQFVPPMSEIYHYPLLCVGWFGLFVTAMIGLPSLLDSIVSGALSLIYQEPIGQVIPFAEYSWGGWFVWAMISYFVIKLYHPPVPDETPLDEGRMRLGWLSFGILILCFSFVPFTISL